MTQYKLGVISMWYQISCKHWVELKFQHKIVAKFSNFSCHLTSSLNTPQILFCVFTNNLSYRHRRFVSIERKYQYRKMKKCFHKLFSLLSSILSSVFPKNKLLDSYTSPNWVIKRGWLGKTHREAIILRQIKQAWMNIWTVLTRNYEITISK